MEIGLAHIPVSLTDSDVVKLLMPILHSEAFSPPPPKRPTNFKVRLDVSEEGIYHKTTGVLIVPEDIVYNFLEWVKSNPIKLDKKSRKIKFYLKGPARDRLDRIITKTPFIDPDKEEKRRKILWDVHRDLRVNAVQLGILFRERYPTDDKEGLGVRSFSIEWEHDALAKSPAYLQFVFEHKLIRIKVRKTSHYLAST
jgi:RNA-dependent RNA polymerase